MLRIGSHLSSSKGFMAMGRTASRIDANVFQFFLRNPRGGRAKTLDPADVAAYLSYAAEHDIGPILAHASYVINLATVEARLTTFVRETVADDLARLAHFPHAMYVIHPGTRKDRPLEDAITTIAGVLDEVIPSGSKNPFLLETMSGHGGEVGGRFEELQAIIDASHRKRALGVCLDTCHVLAAGYDIVNDLDAVLAEIDAVIGLKRLKAVHLNDSVHGLGEHKDRHAKLGEGTIGWDGFARIVNHPTLRDLPFYLETPNDPDGWAEEIKSLRALVAAE